MWAVNAVTHMSRNDVILFVRVIAFTAGVIVFNVFIAEVHHVAAAASGSMTDRCCSSSYCCVRPLMQTVRMWRSSRPDCRAFSHRLALLIALNGDKATDRLLSVGYSGFV